VVERGERAERVAFATMRRAGRRLICVLRRIERCGNCKTALLPLFDCNEPAWEWWCRSALSEVPQRCARSRCGLDGLEGSEVGREIGNGLLPWVAVTGQAQCWTSCEAWRGVVWCGVVWYGTTIQTRDCFRFPRISKVQRRARSCLAKPTTTNAHLFAFSKPTMTTTVTTTMTFFDKILSRRKIKSRICLAGKKVDLLRKASSWAVLLRVLRVLCVLDVRCDVLRFPCTCWRKCPFRLQNGHGLGPKQLASFKGQSTPSTPFLAIYGLQMTKFGKDGQRHAQQQRQSGTIHPLHSFPPALRRFHAIDHIFLQPLSLFPQFARLL